MSEFDSILLMSNLVWQNLTADYNYEKQQEPCSPQMWQSLCSRYNCYLASFENVFNLVNEFVKLNANKLNSQFYNYFVQAYKVG